MTDQLLEACAKATRDAYNNATTFERAWTEAAAAVLAIARPIIERECYEKAAKVCEDYSEKLSRNNIGYECNGYHVADRCGDRIRALIPSDVGQQRGAGE